MKRAVVGVVESGFEFVEVKVEVEGLKKSRSKKF